jgi:hypothetical protein
VLGYRAGKLPHECEVSTRYYHYWRTYDYEELINRDKARLDIFSLRDDSLE